MKLDASWAALAVACSSVATVASANIILPREPSITDIEAIALESLVKRATAQAPNGYTPTRQQCPSNRPRIRSASSLSPQELAWTPKRRNNTVEPMKELLSRLNIGGFDANGFIDRHSSNASALPNIGIAFSGGGYRALMNGAGALSAFDSRSPNATSAGHLGGLLQSATYIAGLSGGSWLLASIYVNNFTSVTDIQNSNPDQSGSLWQFGSSIIQGPKKSKIQLLDTAQYYGDIYDTVQKKDAAGFNTSLTDYWGRALAYQMINATRGGPAYTWSSIADDPSITDGIAPLPLVVADGRAPGELVVSSNTTVFEFNPWEMGSFDPTLYGFAPLKYVGANYSGGELPPDQPCVRGYDSASFIFGTSSSLFNTFLTNLNGTGVPDQLKGVLESILSGFGESNNDIADWSPNPFLGWNKQINPSAGSDRLTLVDGGEDLQNIPLHPLIQPYRNVDVIFAVDSSADTLAPGANWPNGTALVATYERSLTKIENGTAFPAIPDQNTFVNLGLNTHPTFFGCNASNQTGPAPLVVYIPNQPYVYNSNVSTFDPDYNNTERNAIILNGYNVATMANGTVDAQWPTCVGCAVLSRSLVRTRTQIPDACNQCFARYCWDGTRNSTTPAPYNPTPRLQTVSVLGAGVKTSPGFLGAVMAALTALMQIL